MTVLLQQRLKYAISRQESIKIANDKSGNIKVDGKVRRDHRFPLGFMDVVSIEKTNENFRILIDTKGKYHPHRIDAKEAGFKLCKIVKKTIGKNKIPYIVTHDGRTVRFPHPDICIGDTVKFNLATKEIEGVIKFGNGSSIMITAGNNIGRIGILTSVERHIGSYDIVNVKDATGNTFSTRIGNLFVIGDGKTNAISLPKGDGIKLTNIQTRDSRLAKTEGAEDDE
jgi:small subunit ribosomal protein S4e